MRGAETANDEFEASFNQTFETHSYRTELLGGVIMVFVVDTAALGLLGRGVSSPSYSPD